MGREVLEAHNIGCANGHGPSQYFWTLAITSHHNTNHADGNPREHAGSVFISEKWFSAKMFAVAVGALLHRLA